MTKLPTGEALGLAGALIAGALALSSPVRAAPVPLILIADNGGGHAGPGRGAASTQDADPAASRSVAARSRMLECGHQWSAMKRAGTATGTWRDFSRDCLAQR